MAPQRRHYARPLCIVSDGVELALMSLVLAVAVRAAHGLPPSVCPVQAAPDEGSGLVKLGPAGDC